MRGRTNASNGGIFLNATTDNFEVATGNSIVAGDFVEYVYDTGEKPLAGSIIANSKSYSVGTNTGLFVALINSIFTLYKWVDDEIEIVDTYSYTATYMFRIDSTTFKAGVAILRIDVSNETITVINTRADGSYKLNDNIWVDVGASRIYTYDCTDLTNVTNMANLASTDNGVFLCAYGNVFYTLLGSSGSYGKVYLIPWTVDTSTGAITKGTLIQIDSTGSSSSAQTNAMYPLTTEVLANRYIIFAYSYASYQTNAKTICVFDLEQKRVVIQTPLIIKTSYAEGLICSTDMHDDGTILIVERIQSSVTEKAIGLFKFDTANQVFSELDNADLDDNFPAIFERGNNKYSLHKDGYYSLLEVVNDNIVYGEVTDYVKEWAGTGNPIGVAKQSGNAGSTIAVYIPQVNS